MILFVVVILMWYEGLTLYKIVFVLLIHSRSNKSNQMGGELRPRRYRLLYRAISRTLFLSFI